MPESNTVAKVEIYNMERQNVRIEQLQNNQIITPDNLGRLGYENIEQLRNQNVEHEQPNIREIMREIENETDARYDAICQAMNNGNFSDIKRAFIAFYDYFHLITPFHITNEGNNTVAQATFGQYKINIKIINHFGQFRISIMDGIFERSRLELFNNRVVSLHCGDIPQPTIFKFIYWSDGTTTATTELLYEAIPGFKDYKINKLAPHDVRGPNNEIIEPLRPNERCKYIRYKLPGNKFIYRHKLVAFAEHIPGWQRLSFTMTRSEYNKRVHRGSLFVIDHFDNDTTNNEPSNLRIINQRQNLRRRYH